MRLILFLLVGFVTSATLGCKGNKVDSSEKLRLALVDFRQFLESLESDGVKPPKKMAEFLPVEPMAPVASEYIKSGELVYAWGSGLSSSGNQIIAFEKGAETNGGWVLLQNGEVQNISSEQFGASAKAMTSK